jgi:hypothetical protein
MCCAGCHLLLASAALRAGGAGGKLFLGNYARAEAAARARDRAVLVLQQAGCALRAELNFPRADYEGEQLPVITGVTVLQLQLHLHMGVVFCCCLVGVNLWVSGRGAVARCPGTVAACASRAANPLL